MFALVDRSDALSSEPRIPQELLVNLFKGGTISLVRFGNVSIFP